jgi:hypothetical protein
MTKKDLLIKKENFLIEYCKKMGWNPNELTNKQMLAITTHKDWKNPQQV